MANSASGESMLARFDRVLAAFGPQRRELSLGEIARSARLPSSTAHRILADMVRVGWIDASGSRYRVGTRLWELASRAAVTENVASAAIPFMSDVHAVMRHHVHIGVIEGHDVLFAERIEAKESPVPLRSVVAGRLPLHLSATGLALLSMSSTGFLELYCRNVLSESEAGSPNAAQLLRDVRSVKERGFASQQGRIDPNTGGVSVPVRTGVGHPPVALGVVLPTEAMEPGDVPAIVQTLLVASQGIARALGAVR